jgi:hypothetical protein
VCRCSEPCPLGAPRATPVEVGAVGAVVDDVTRDTVGGAAVELRGAAPLLVRAAAVPPPPVGELPGVPAPVADADLRAGAPATAGVGCAARECAGSLLGSRTGAVSPGSGTPPSRLVTSSASPPTQSTRPTRSKKWVTRARRPVGSTKTTTEQRSGGRKRYVSALGAANPR